MGVDTTAGITEPLRQVHFYNKENSCVVENDPQTTVDRLASAALSLNSLVIQEFGGRQGGERERGLTQSVIAAAFQNFGDTDPHPGPFDKAAVIIRGITGGHPFVDGNKRTGFLTAALYLEQIGIPMPSPVSVDGMYDLCMGISSGELRDLDEIAMQLERIWQREKNPKAYTIK